jgi:hypothetical protein
MKKISAFSNVLDVLNDEGKNKLLISARRLITAQRTVKAAPVGRKTAKQKSQKIAHNTVKI